MIKKTRKQEKIRKDELMNNVNENDKLTTL